MISWIWNALIEEVDQRCANRHRQQLRSKGVFLEVALVLGEYQGKRATDFNPSLGRTGHRDWSLLEANTHWSAQKDTNNLGQVFARLVNKVRTPEAEFDIADVRNILLSKSDLSTFATLESFENRSPNYEYGEGTSQDLQGCLDHNEIRCLKGTPLISDSFSSFGWDDRLLLNNHGGSHHFSAARRIARELGVKVPLQLVQHHHALDEATVGLIERTLALILIPNQELLNDLRSALRTEGVPIVQGDFRAPPYCGDDTKLLPLDLSNPLSSTAAAYLRRCGFTDLVSHLLEDFQQQMAFR
jgi:hypothetical protein